MNAPLIIDSFAGGGGASTGIEMALGRSPDIAINHNPAALAMHEANHPETLHLSENIYKVDPLDYVNGKHVGLAWFSPDCKHFSKAKGGKPVERNIRDLAWIVVLWGRRAKPDVIFLENVEEFREWGPLVETDRGLMPDPEAKGHTFQQWCKALRSLGYKIEWRELRACDYGAPTIRKRFFLIARRDGKKIIWPNPTHGKPTDPDVISGRKLPWRTAAEIIDWSIPCPSIFDTSEEIMAKHGLRAVRPLAPATMSRTARGLKRYVLDAARPFLVNLTHGARLESVDDPFNTITGAHRGEKAVIAPSVIKFQTGSTGHPANEPLHTVTANSFVKKPGGAAPVGIITPVLTAGQHGGSNRPVDEPHHTITASKKDQNAIIVPTLVGCGGRAGQSRPRGGDEPTATITAKADVCLATAFMAQHNNDSRRDGGVNPGRPMDEPISTVTQTGSQQGVIAASLMSMKGSDRRDSELDEPHPTVLAGGMHSALVTPFMTKYYGTGDGARVDEPAHTVTIKDRFGFVEGEVATPPLSDTQIARARQVAHFMREHGFWDEREFVTVTIDGDLYTIIDIGMRMLTPRELFGAQGFPADYIIDPIHNGKPLSKSDQIGCCGNSVSPPMAAALVGANCSDLMVYREAAE